MPSRYLGLGLLAAAALGVEIALTRLFSVLFYPPFVFVVLAVAVLGIGLGAGLAAGRPGWRQAGWIPDYPALAGLSTLVILAAALALPVPWPTIALTGLLILPFFWVGLALSGIFSQAAECSPRLYLADLGGAGLAALLIVPLLNHLGVINGLLLLAFCLGGAGMILNRGRLRPSSGLALLLSLCALATHNLTPWLTLDLAQIPAEKPASQVLAAGGRPLRFTWDAFARTDLIDPGDGSPYHLYMDGAAGSVMPQAGDDELLLGDIGFFPFATEQPQRVFVIGPGGGLDVAFGLRSGAAEIVAVEVSPSSVALVRDLAAYNGDIYGRPSVRVVVDEGRSVLRREAAAYDLIFLSQVVTLAAERSGFALVENSAYTLEAFQDYLDHLTPDGQIALKLYDEATLTRALATALAALNRRGLDDDDALTHVIALLDGSADPAIPLLMVRNRAWSREDSLSLGAVARQVGFTPLFLPHVLAQPPLDAVAAGQQTFAQVIAGAASDMRPTTDNRPFFFQFEPGVPRSLWGLTAGLAVVVAGLSVGVLRRYRGEGAGRGRAFALYFAALGGGFMLVEIAAIQQTRLFLGHPILAVTVVLATLLMGGGLGSGILGQRLQGLPWWPPLVVSLWLGLWMLAWPVLSGAFVAAPQGTRLALTIAGLLPLGAAMGVPFPLGLRAVGRLGPGEVALAWTVNGILSVVGSVAAVVLAMTAGYSWVLGVGAGVYSLAGLAAWAALPRNYGKIRSGEMSRESATG